MKQMKKYFFTLNVLLLLAITTLQSCNNSSQKTEVSSPEQVKEQYQCPMKCTEEIFDKPGKCPVCEMELEKVAKS
jgi:hypothetical protein